MGSKVKRLSLVQPNFKQGPGAKAAYLPYSSALLWSYAQLNDLIRTSFKLDRLVYKREPLNDLAEQLSDNDVVGFSTYVWNRNYNFTLAQKIKDINPNVLTVFGGPEPPIHSPTLFTTDMPFADIVVKNEGEVVFSSILQHYILGTDYKEIRGLKINSNGNIIDTGMADRIQDLDSIPSPYLNGTFDRIFDLEEEWNGTLETNRGCPYKCTFCDWGSLTYNKMKQFDMDRIFSELEWMGEKKIGYLDITDSNFGLFVDRDNKIVDKLISIQDATGYPYKTGWSWAKNQQSEVVSIAKKLINSGHFNNGLTISLQSLSDITLSAIKRKNLQINKIVDIFDECNKQGVPLNVELICGLPAETLSSWEDTLYGVFEAGQHDSIEVWQAQLLENAEMNLSQREEYKIRGVKVLDYFANADNEQAPEYNEIITETSTMSLEEMVEAYKLSWYLMTWHTGGFSQYIARFIRKYCGESYKDFYTKFRTFLQNDPTWKNEEDHMTQLITDWFRTGKRISSTLGNIKITAYNVQYKTIFDIHYNNSYEHYYGLIEKFLDQYDLPDEVKTDLIKINRCIVSKPRDLKNYSASLSHNIFDYIINDSALGKDTEKILVNFPHDLKKSEDINWFIESIFFARRRSFGKNYMRTET